MKNINELSNAELYCFIKQHIAKEFIEMLVNHDFYSYFNSTLLECLVTDPPKKYLTLSGVETLSVTNPIIFIATLDPYDKLVILEKCWKEIRSKNKVLTVTSWQNTQHDVFRKILNNVPYKFIQWSIKNKIFTKFCDAVRAQLPESLFLRDPENLYYMTKLSPFALIDFESTCEGCEYWYAMYEKYYRYQINN